MQFIIFINHGIIYNCSMQCADTYTNKLSYINQYNPNNSNIPARAETKA